MKSCEKLATGLGPLCPPRPDIVIKKDMISLYMASLTARDTLAFFTTPIFPIWLIFSNFVKLMTSLAEDWKLYDKEGVMLTRPRGLLYIVDFAKP